MRIISNFKDYYDQGAVYGVDMGNVFARVNRDGILRHNDIRLLIGNTQAQEYGKEMWQVLTLDEGTVRRRLVGFCGKVYVMFEYSAYKSQKPIQFYTMSEMMIFLTENNLFMCAKNRPYQYRARKRDDEHRIIENDELFKKIGSPIFYITTDFTAYWYPRLSDFSFYKVKEPREAFSEIEQYNINVLRATDPSMETITDMVRLEQHGFDKKQSFRHRKS